MLKIFGEMKWKIRFRDKRTFNIRQMIKVDYVSTNVVLFRFISFRFVDSQNPKWKRLQRRSENPKLESKLTKKFIWKDGVPFVDNMLWSFHKSSQQ